MNLRSKVVKYNRRNVLAAIAIAPASTATAFLVPAAEGREADPHPALFDRWLIVRDKINTGYPGDDDPIWQELNDLEDNLIDTPVATVAGLLATLKFALEEEYNLGDPKTEKTRDARFADSLITNIAVLEGEMTV